MNPITIRLAKPNDAETIAAFNRAMAQETENKDLIPEVILAGVRSLFEHPSRGFYIVAETDGNVVACLMITTEWSDWRNGVFWWVQSVYVQTAYRRRGIYRSMYSFVKELAEKEPGVCGFRLYVEQDNSRAQNTYRALGMTQSPYCLFEELKSGVMFLREKS
ncbi:MAG: GNAT family N-acetyltransferase [Cyanobacteria bacterium J06636_28]